MFQALAIVGATASGKSEIAVKICSRLRDNGTEAELISVDSRKIYKYFDIGTAKPPKVNFKWHLVGILEPTEKFSAKKFEVLAKKLIKEIKEQNKIPILVGGTWLYYRAIEKGLFDEPEDKSLRERLEKKLQQNGKESLWDMLKKIDPKACEKLHPNDTFRIIRAIEVKIKTGRSILELGWKEGKGEKFPLLKVGIWRSAEELKRRITQRVTKQIQAGLIEETRKLYESFGESTPLLKSIAYLEPYLYIRGKISYDEMVKMMIKRNFKYGKYQIKVFSRDGTIWFKNEQELINFSIRALGKLIM